MLLGFSIKGCKAAAHALRTFLCNNPGYKKLLKIDVINESHSAYRDALLNEVKLHVAEIYSYVLQSFSSLCQLLHRIIELRSAVGYQQGGPLGPATCSLNFHHVTRKLKSYFNVWYVDDGTIYPANIVFLTGTESSAVFSIIGVDQNRLGKLYIPEQTHSHMKFKCSSPLICLINKSNFTPNTKIQTTWSVFVPKLHSSLPSSVDVP